MHAVVVLPLGMSLHLLTLGISGKDSITAVDKTLVLIITKQWLVVATVPVPQFYCTFYITGLEMK